MGKRKIESLTAVLNQRAKGPDAGTAAAAPRTQTRSGRVMVAGWLPIEARSSFRLIQAKYPEKKMQDLMVEAVNDLFAKYNVPQTAKLLDQIGARQ